VHWQSQRKTRRANGHTKSYIIETPVTGPRNNRGTAGPLPIGILHSYTRFGQSLSRLPSQAGTRHPAHRSGKAPPPDHSHRKYYFPEAIFFLTVINVLLYSKYPMALDGYGRTVGKRLSGGL
jgi:hypothetical protein